MSYFVDDVLGPSMYTKTEPIVLRRQDPRYPYKVARVGNSFPAEQLVGSGQNITKIKFTSDCIGTLISTQWYEQDNIGGYWNQDNDAGPEEVRSLQVPLLRDLTIDGSWNSEWAEDGEAEADRADGVSLKGAGSHVENVTVVSIPGTALTLQAVDNETKEGVAGPFDDRLPNLTNVSVAQSNRGVVVRQNNARISKLSIAKVFGVGLTIDAYGVTASEVTIAKCNTAAVRLTNNCRACVLTLTLLGDSVLDLSDSELDQESGNGNLFRITCDGELTIQYPNDSDSYNLAAGTELIVNGTRLGVQTPTSDTDVFAEAGLTLNSSAAGAANHSALQALVDAGAPVNLWRFRGGNADTRSIYLSRTLKLDGVGRSFQGLGKHLWATGVSDFSTILLMSADDYAVTFNGTSVTATASGAVLTLSGRTVHDTDKHNSFYISGGTNFVAGWYTIISVTVGSNRWTVDRNCTNGSSASGMTGRYCPELIQNWGGGHSHFGLNFEGKRNSSATDRGIVGYHVLSADQPYGATPSPTGFHSFFDCTWSNFEVGMLVGPGMMKFGEKATSWYLLTDNHADNLNLFGCVFYLVNNAMVFRSQQSVIHRIVGMHAYVSDSVFRFDAGGKLDVSGLEVSGESGTQRILTLGSGVNYNNNGSYTIRGFSFDGATRNPQLIVTEFDNYAYNGLNTVIFDGGNLSRAAENDDEYLVDIQSCTTLILRGIQGNGYVNGIWEGSCRLRKGPSEAPYGNSPLMIVDGCLLGVTNPTDIIDHDSSDSGIKIKFTNCHDGRGTLFADQTITTT